MKHLASILLLALLSGCAASGKPFVDVPSVSNQGTIYIYRENSLALGGRTASFKVNPSADQIQFKLDRNGYSWFHLPPGQYKVIQTWPFDIQMFKPPLETKVEIKSGESHYVKFNVGGCQSTYPNMCIQWQLGQVSSQQGHDEIVDNVLQ